MQREVILITGASGFLGGLVRQKLLTYNPHLMRRETARENFG